MKRSKYKRTIWEDGITKINANNLNHLEKEVERLSLDSLSPSQLLAGNGIKLTLLDDGTIKISSLITEADGKIVIGQDTEPDLSPYYRLNRLSAGDIFNFREEGTSEDEDKMITLLTNKKQEVVSIRFGGSIYKLHREGGGDELDNLPDGPGLKKTITDLEKKVLELEKKLESVGNNNLPKKTELEPEVTGLLNNAWSDTNKRPYLKKILVDIGNVAFKSEVSRGSEDITLNND